MFRVIRKMTGKVVGRNVPHDSLDSYLATLPTGVYGVEDSEGNEVREVTVKAGRVSTGS
jgi:hypothetical protein